MACIPIKVARSLKKALQEGNLNVDDLLKKKGAEREKMLLEYLDGQDIKLKEKQAKNVSEFIIKKYNTEIPNSLAEEIFTKTKKIEKLRAGSKAISIEDWNKMDRPPQWAEEYTSLNSKIESVLNPANELGGIDTIKSILKDSKDSIMGKTTVGGKALETGKQLADLVTSGVYKSIKASFDMSYGLRQGFKILTKSPGTWGKNFSEAWKVWKNIGSKSKMDAVMNDFKARYLAHPYYEALLDGNLAFGAIEDFFPTAIATKILGIGNIFKASDEAFTVFSQGSRFGLAVDMIEKQLKLKGAKGIDGLTKEEVRSISQFANSITGRGSLGSFENQSGFLNKLFFSARFIRSQVDTFIMPFNPTVSPFVRAEAAKHTGITFATIGGMMAVAGMFGEVETDARSSNFGKLRISDQTSLDLTAGIGSYIVLAVRTATGETKSARTGKVTELNTGAFGGQTTGDVFTQWARNKLAPAPGAIANILNGRDFSGEKPTLISTGMSVGVPISIENIFDLMQTEEGGVIVAAWVADVLGMSSQTFPR